MIARPTWATVLSILLCTVAIARTFGTFDGQRVKVVESPIRASAGVVQLDLSAKQLDSLSLPAALTARVRGSATAASFRVAIDGTTVCENTLGAGEHRVDCTIATWN